MKKILFNLIFIFALSIGGLALSDGTAEASELTALDEFILNLENDGSADALEQIEKIANLSEEEKKEFNEILSSPDKLNEELQSNQEVTTKDSFIPSKDSVINKSPMIALASTPNGTYRSSAQTTLTSFGITLIKYEIVGTYKITNGKITTAYDAKGETIRNWVPGASTVFQNGYGDIISGKYRGQANFSYDLGVGKFGIARIGTVKTGFYVTPTGKITSTYLNRET
ncbi:hypothetical protein JI667_19055 [Bacillus sp. NTK074B]|uniref:hypothetical protein n=1 Tax=Bacillus sp. NTK074B TaxID=2802174 RepID=UPI001A8CB6E5|nr:hypothetical protein [Bacillus sp. NTK074B]